MKIVLENGFLDDKMDYVINDIKKKNKKYFELAYAYNNFCYRIIERYKGIEIDTNNKELLYLLPAFGEVNKQYQASIILLQYGFSNNFENNLRCMLELYILMSYPFSLFPPLATNLI